MLSVKNIVKKQGDHFLLNNISFHQQKGEKIAIAGETGSGKTTLAKIAAGLEQADSGEVLFDGQTVKGIHDKLMPGHKGIAYLSQYFELSNNYRVSELLAYANDLSDDFSEELYHICRIDHLLQRWSQTLSGGEKQRVALAKLLTTKPRLLILDEPFSNLDWIHKTQLKEVLDNIEQHFQINFILVSHDANDIIPWADKILVMKGGEIVQAGTPHIIYFHPKTEYVAGLFGRYNLFPPEIISGNRLDSSHIIRPEQLLISNAGIAAVVEKILFYGSHYELRVRIQEHVFFIKVDNDNYLPGQIVQLQLKKEIR